MARARRERKGARARVQGTREAHLVEEGGEEGGGEAQPESKKEAAAARVVHGKFGQRFARRGKWLRVEPPPVAKCCLYSNTQLSRVVAQPGTDSTKLSRVVAAPGTDSHPSVPGGGSARDR